MRLTVGQLSGFDCIVRLGSFNTAARHMNLAQPTVSQRIRELALALGRPLFARTGITFARKRPGSPGVLSDAKWRSRPPKPWTVGSTQAV